MAATIHPKSEAAVEIVVGGAETFPLAMKMMIRMMARKEGSRKIRAKHQLEDTPMRHRSRLL